MGETTVHAPNQQKSNDGMNNEKDNNHMISPRKTNRIPKEPTLVLVYAFHDNIIGIVHQQTNGQDACNGLLRREVQHGNLLDYGIHAYASFRDYTSRKDDFPS